jgi:hypothetical protein
LIQTDQNEIGPVPYRRIHCIVLISRGFDPVAGRLKQCLYSVTQIFMVSHHKDKRATLFALHQQLLKSLNRFVLPCELQMSTISYSLASVRSLARFTKKVAAPIGEPRCQAAPYYSRSGP